MSCQTHSGQQLQAQAGNLLLADDFRYKLHMALATNNIRNLGTSAGECFRSPADILGAISAEGLGTLPQQIPGSDSGRALGNASKSMPGGFLGAISTEG